MCNYFTSECASLVRWIRPGLMGPGASIIGAGPTAGTDQLAANRNSTVVIVITTRGTDAPHMQAQHSSAGLAV